MKPLRSTTNPFGGVILDPEALPESPESFQRQLAYSMEVWTKEGWRVVWLEIPIDKSALIPRAVQAGFAFHHSGEAYLMLTYPLDEAAFIPPYATHFIGAGGVVLNDEGELLVVWEKVDRVRRPHYYKLPGGALKPQEHLVEGVIREVREETGIDTQFESLVCFRHTHGYRYGKSDIYFVCRLSPLNHEIRIQEREIEESLWMPVDRFLSAEGVAIFNKRIVQAALAQEGCLIPTWIEGYQVDPRKREIFMPRAADGRSEA